jgi:uncharacterized protein
VKKIFSILLLSFALINVAHAQDSAASVPPTKKALILKFIDVFGTKEAMANNLNEMLQTLPPDSEEAKKMKEGIKVNEIIDRLIPIYDKQFSEAELQAFIDFYTSENGKKLVAGIPAIMQESVEVSAQYFREKFPEMEEK